MKPDIQICNHNYLLADASHRQEDRLLLLRSYQALVVDEAHKLPDAARQMYTETLSSRAMDELCLLLQQAHYKDFARQLRTTFLSLSFSCTQGFSKLRRKVSEPFVLTPFRRAALIDCIALLQNAGGLPDVPRYLLNRLGEAEASCAFFFWRCRRASYTSTTMPMASPHSAQPATAYRSCSAAPCGTHANPRF